MSSMIPKPHRDAGVTLGGNKEVKRIKILTP
jgi:hypothetical protein